MSGLTYFNILFFSLALLSFVGRIASVLDGLNVFPLKSEGPAKYTLT